MTDQVSHTHEITNTIELGDISRKGLRFSATPHDIARIKEACTASLRKAEEHGFERTVLVFAHPPAEDER